MNDKHTNRPFIKNYYYDVIFFCPYANNYDTIKEEDRSAVIIIKSFVKIVINFNFKLPLKIVIQRRCHCETPYQLPYFVRTILGEISTRCNVP